MTDKNVYHEMMADGRVRCTLCPRFCELREDQRGLCFVRKRVDDEIILTSYGRSSGFMIDPIEKKPLNHFLPGSSVLSFGTAGCNLSCNFCQNWDMSKSRQMDILQASAHPDTIAKAARVNSCHSVAYTYNDPVIFLEYAIDTALACKDMGIRSVAVTAGYINAPAREAFFAHMDAANVDLKGFTEDFYRRMCSGSLAPVLETLEYLCNETDVWVEITTLLIPGENDSPKELDKMTGWINDHLGRDIPLHFTAFHPDYRLTDHSPTTMDTLIQAKQIAGRNGINHVYIGNIASRDENSTYCSHCSRLLIGRRAYTIDEWHLGEQGRCTYCDSPLPGVFDNQPGTWGNRCQRISIESYT